MSESVYAKTFKSLGYKPTETRAIVQLFSASSFGIDIGQVPFADSKQGKALKMHAKNYREQLRMREEYCRERYGNG